MQLSLEQVTDQNEVEVLAFLKRHENFSMFLLGNLELYGKTVQDAPYSGNYKLIHANGKIVTVFCLSQKGMLFITSELIEPVFSIVKDACKEEPFSFHGIVGNSDFCSPYWEYLKSHQLIKSETFTENYVLFSLSLIDRDFTFKENVRSLREADYIQWIKLRLDYIAEEGLPNDFTEEQRRKAYLNKVERGVTWGLFLNDELVSIADLSASSSGLGQVGGLYTIPHHRRKGYSRALMHYLIHDCHKRLKINKFIIYTAEKSLGAQGLYKSLGCIHEGFYTLLIGTP